MHKKKQIFRRRVLFGHSELRLRPVNEQATAFLHRISISKCPLCTCMIFLPLISQRRRAQPNTATILYAMPKYKIAIVGAGPAGTTLARILLHKKIDVEIVIFEGEQSLNTRTQGGTLDLHTASGQEALKQCGLYERFTELARYDAEGSYHPIYLATIWRD